MADNDRSSVHPSATWAECVELLHKLDSLGRKPVSVAVLANAFGLKNAKTKSLQAKITASRLFGLITVKSGVIAMTDSGHDILHPTTADIRPLERACFVRPKLYRRLLESFDGKSLPREDLFENILVKEYGLSDISKKRASKCFQESAGELGFLINGVICSDAVDDDGSQAFEEGPLPESVACVDSQEGPNMRSVAASSPMQFAPSSSAESFISISAPASNGGLIEIRVPVNAEVADFELAKSLLDVFENRMKPVSEGGDSVG